MSAGAGMSEASRVEDGRVEDGRIEAVRAEDVRAEAVRIEAVRAEIVRRGYDFIDARQFEDLFACFHDDVLYRRQGVGELEGLAAVRHFYEIDRPIASGAHALEAVIADGPWVAVRGWFTGTLKDGSEAHYPFTDWVHFRGDLIDLRETLFPAR